jgi:hypothetical protein
MFQKYLLNPVIKCRPCPLVKLAFEDSQIKGRKKRLTALITLFTKSLAAKSSNLMFTQMG